MGKKENIRKSRQLLTYWQAQEPAFRISVWIGMFLITSIIYLHHYWEPLATDTEFVTEGESQEMTALEMLNDDEDASVDLEAHPSGTVETLQEQEFAVKVRAGDTLSDIFTRYEINTHDLYAILDLREAKPALANLKPNQEIFITLDRSHNLLKLSTQIAFNKILYITRPEPKFQARIEEQAAVDELTTVGGVIHTSLYHSTRDAKIPQKIALQLANIFAGKLNFARDLHPGDVYKIIYQRKVVNDMTVAIGNILAAKIVANGKPYTAIRYEPSKGQARYYSPDGQSFQRAFMRNPVPSSRISSKFNPNRLHPILNIRRPHYGIDYSAPAGTPVKAAGDGKIIFAGRKGGYGNTIIINHGNQITTRYGHLKKFMKNIRPGLRVGQGDIIGFVGSTGLATGPHLHYEYRVNDKALNPLTVSLPENYALPHKELQQFKHLSSVILAELDKNATTTQLAQKATTTDAG